MAILGLHHITLVCANAQRTIDFYTNVLGLHFVKKTVNYDDPGSYHLYFGDAVGRPGTVVTFFEWPGASAGAPGIGGTHHFALVVDSHDGLLKWKRRLTDLGIAVEGPLDQRYFISITFNDPDGANVEIATRGPGWFVDESADRIGTEYREPPAQLSTENPSAARAMMQHGTWPKPVADISADMFLDGLHHITAICSDIHRTHAFYSDLLGLRRFKMTTNYDDPGSAHWYWGAGEGKPGTLISAFERPPAHDPRARMGAGQTHHIAFCVPDEQDQLVWRDRFIRAGLRVTTVLDRVYFKSIYTHDPDGHIVELATAGPGFTMDEDVAGLGQNLKLPSWLESRRAEIERRLHPVTVQQR